MEGIEVMLKNFRNLKPKKNGAFSLFEVILSLVIVVIVIFFGKKLVDISAENTRSVEEAKIIDSGLHSMLNGIRNDLESVVMLDKNQPIFEICARDGGEGIAMFCFTTTAVDGEPNVTSAVCYDIAKLDVGKFEVSRISLSASATLSLQTALSNGSSFKKFFGDADESCKQVRKFDLLLSDFKIRAATRKRNGKIVLTAPNAKMIFSGGSLVCEKSGKWPTVGKELIFFDVTLRALQSRDAAKFNATRKKDPNGAMDFLFTNSRKSFGRVTFNGMSL